MKSKIFIFTTLILVVFLFVITSCDNFLNAKNKTTININLDLSKILKTSRNETTTIPTEYILKVFAYNAATYKSEDEIQNLPLLTQTENKVDINGNVKARLDVEIGLNVIFVAKLYQGKSEKPLYAGKSEVIKIKATDNKVHLVLTRENADLDIDILVHDHTFAEDWTSDATHHWHAATCEHDVTDSKAEHSFGNWTTTKEPTETEEGRNERTCTICGYTDSVVLQPAPAGFRFVKGTTITGTESWTPESHVFVSGRKLTIPDLIVSDHEVTRGEYKSVMGSDPSKASAYDKDGNKLTGEDVLNNPVDYVSWYDVLVYCNKRSKSEGLIPCYSILDSTDPDEWGTVPTDIDYTWNAVICNWNENGYRLPTEAEWEWLARGGENYTYAGSDTVDDVAWYRDNTNETGTREVKTKSPNGYGLYDMSGNVYECCWDWKGSISDSTAADGDTAGDTRVARGGSYDYGSSDGKVVLRNGIFPSAGVSSSGFRVVRLATEVIDHTHKFSTDWTSDATHHWHASTCGHTTEVSGKAAHSFDDWTVTKAATEEAEGTKERTCIVCGYTATEVIEKLAHTHKFATDWTKDETNHWYAATCEHTTEVSGKAAHSFGEYVSNNDATTQADGTKTRECSECGYKDTVTDEGSKIHVHTFATDWTKDETYHWYAATCGHTDEKSGFAEHTFVNEVCTICEYSRIPEGFVFVKGTTINGNETWTPSSEVFVSGRKLTIPDLIVSDHEVTRGEYKAVMGSDPSKASAYDKDGNELTGEYVLNNPVNYVNWYDALVYCNKLSIKENLTPCYTIDGSTNPDAWGTVPTSSNSTWNAVICNWNANGYRLPTAAEWEWLARGGQKYTYAGSDTLDEVAWYTDNTNDKGTRDVKTKAPNGYELYDMSGNVCEWCWDWYGGISDSTAADGASSGACRVLRGGSWDHVDSWGSVYLLCYDVPDYRYNYLGFRVVRPFPSTTE